MFFTRVGLTQRNFPSPDTLPYLITLDPVFCLINGAFMSTGSTFCRNLFLTIHEKSSSIDFNELVELSLLVSEVKRGG